MHKKPLKMTSTLSSIPQSHCCLFVCTSQCNRVCGMGQQTRGVYCQANHQLPNTVTSNILPDSRCDASEVPISAQECNMGPCDGLEWVTSSWSGVNMYSTYEIT